MRSRRMTTVDRLLDMLPGLPRGSHSRLTTFQPENAVEPSSEGIQIIDMILLFFISSVKFFNQDIKPS